jgi:hypothetical protein
MVPFVSLFGPKFERTWIEKSNPRASNLIKDNTIKISSTQLSKELLPSKDMML